MAKWLVIEKIGGTTFPVIGNAAIIHALDKEAAKKIYCVRRCTDPDLVSAYNTETGEDFYFFNYEDGSNAKEKTRRGV